MYQLQQFNIFMGWKVIVLFTVEVPILKKITQLGSNWNNGTNAGAFYWNLFNGVAGRGRYIGGWLIWCNGFRLNQKYISPLEKYASFYYQEERKCNR